MSERSGELTASTVSTASTALTAFTARVAAAADSGLFQLLRGALGDEPARAAFARVQVVQALLRPAGERVSRAELAQAVNMELFLDVTDRVPLAAA